VRLRRRRVAAEPRGAGGLRLLIRNAPAGAVLAHDSERSAAGRQQRLRVAREDCGLRETLERLGRAEGILGAQR
jgi:hypothetical protein